MTTSTRIGAIGAILAITVLTVVAQAVKPQLATQVIAKKQTVGLGDPVIVSVIVRRRPQVGGENLTLSLAERFFLTADHAEYADTFRVFCVVRGYRSGRCSAAGTLGESGQRSVSSPLR